MNRLFSCCFATAFLSSCAAIFVTAADVSADTVFESGTLGPTGIAFGAPGSGTAPGSSGVNPDVFSGVRFQLLQPVRTTRVGGHFVHDSRTSNTFFGAIVTLDSATDFPNSVDLSTPDVVGHTMLTFPDPSAEVFGDLEVFLDPGWHALVFGSGLFGAAGSGAAVLNNPDIGNPSYIAVQPCCGSEWINLSPVFRNFRLVVEGKIVPEPSTLGVLSFNVFGFTLWASVRRGLDS
jgi:hypothetical protein